MTANAPQDVLFAGFGTQNHSDPLALRTSRDGRTQHGSGNSSSLLGHITS
jgi:hypothetical protein